jgi:hypothetical protein
LSGLAKWIWIVVARIAPEPISTGVSVTEYRSRQDYLARSTVQAVDDQLPPILAPVPTPVPAPAIQPPSQAFAAALVAEQLPVKPPSVVEVKLRFPSTWRAPASSLHLADREV